MTSLFNSNKVVHRRRYVHWYWRWSMGLFYAFRALYQFKWPTPVRLGWFLYRFPILQLPREDSTSNQSNFDYASISKTGMEIEKMESWFLGSGKYAARTHLCPVSDQRRAWNYHGRKSYKNWLFQESDRSYDQSNLQKDPSPECQRVRDFIDCRNCIKLPCFGKDFVKKGEFFLVYFQVKTCVINGDLYDTDFIRILFNKLPSKKKVG